MQSQELQIEKLPAAANTTIATAQWGHAEDWNSSRSKWDVPFCTFQLEGVTASDR